MLEFKRLFVLLISVLLLISGCGFTTPDNPEATYELKDRNTEKFNDGIVDYGVEQEITYTNPFDPGLLGTFVNKKTQGVTQLFTDTFKTSAECGGAALTKDISIESSILTVPDGGVWTLDENTFNDEVYQVQFDYTKFTPETAGSEDTEGVLLGFYTEDRLKNYSAGLESGLYIIINEKSQKISFFCPGSENAGEDNPVTLEIPGLNLNGDFSVIATCEKKVTLYCGQSAVYSVKISEGKYSVTDGSGTEKLAGSLGNANLEGRYSAVTCYNAKCSFDRLTVYQCTKGEKTVKNTCSATPREGYSLGLDITDKTDLVSICYSLWHNAINGNGTGKILNVSNVTELLEDYNFSAAKGFVSKEDGVTTNNAYTKFHYWAEPAQGYYRSTDETACRNNMTMLYNANVDFIIIDYTYATAPGYAPGTGTWETYINGPTTVLLDTIMQMRSEGLGTPYVVFWMGSDNMFDYMKKYFLSQEKWADCFVYWDGNPFIMKWRYNGTDTYDGLTVRGMYGLQGSASVGQWSYLEVDNSCAIAYDAEGNPEHMLCDVATQRTYMSDLSSACGRNGGRFWNGHWQNVYNVHPKIVTITWWNEWCAQLYNIDGAGWVFTDEFNQEYSRDIEPMKGGHGDLYYRWLCQYVEYYKAGKACPNLVET